MKGTTITVLALSLIASYTTSAGTCSITLYSKLDLSGTSTLSLTKNGVTYNNGRLDYSAEVSSNKECHDMAAKEVGSKNKFPYINFDHEHEHKIQLRHEVSIANSVYYEYYSNGKLEDAKVLGEYLVH